MENTQIHPVNFFMAGGQYITDKLNIQMIDTSNPSAFDNIDLTTVKPDMMQDYINSDAPQDMTEEQGGFFGIFGN